MKNYLFSLYNLVGFLLLLRNGSSMKLRSNNPWQDKVKLTENCAVTDSQKTDCGYLGITIEICEGQGCCYSIPTTGDIAPWCFYPGTGVPSTAPTAEPSLTPTSASPSLKPTTNSPTISLAPSTHSPTRKPTVVPSVAVKTDSSSLANTNIIVVAIVVISIIIIAAVSFLIYSYFYIYGPKPAEPAEKKEKKVQLSTPPPATNEEAKESHAYTSIYTNCKGNDEFKFNRRDFFNDTVDLEDDYNLTSHKSFGWFEDRDHGFVN